MKKTNISDTQLNNVAVAKNVDLLSNIYFEYADSLFRYGQKFTINDQLIEDCIHDLFVNLTVKEHLLAETIDIRLYIFRSFRNNLLRILSRERKIDKISQD